MTPTHDGTGTPPRDHAELRRLLDDRLPGLAPGQARIARLVLRDPEGTAWRTIRETAELAEVHQSSLVRFATMLGLAGWPQLVALCRQHLAVEARLVNRFARAEARAGAGDLLRTAAAQDRDNLERTFTRIPPERWQETVRLLAEAERVHVMGLRKCLPVAQLLSYLLGLVRPGVHLVAPVTGMLVDELRALRADDVFVGISIRRYTAETVAALEHARRQDLRTVALTDDAASPLARAAETSYLVDTDGPTVLRSVSAFVSLVQALATAVATHRGTSSREELLTDERLLDEFSVYDG